MPPTLVYGPCSNPNHDHADEEGPLLCNDCGEPMHYDSACEWYVHDRYHATCFLIPGRPANASACQRRRVRR
jgi:hypothetical protein